MPTRDVESREHFDNLTETRAAPDGFQPESRSKSHSAQLQQKKINQFQQQSKKIAGKLKVAITISSIERRVEGNPPVDTDVNSVRSRRYPRESDPKVNLGASVSVIRGEG